jgi:Domain of unknown function (DUF1906)
MLAHQLQRMARNGRAAAACALLAALAVPAAASDASARSAPGLKQVSYLGYTFTIPGSWPVINDAAHPRGCVRFDRHAVYLGTPGVNQDCPSWLFGTTETLLIQPGPASSATRSTENPIARQVTVAAAGISLTATFDADPTTIYRILASAGFPAPVIRVPNPAQLAAAGAPAGGGPAGGAQAAAALGLGVPSAVLASVQAVAASGQRSGGTPALPARVTNFRGRGFDACTAPSRAYMRAWRRHSSYRAVGIYIGGADRACNQRNLGPRWVRHEANAGWHFIPMYAGPQAAFREIRAPRRQGRRAAVDAVGQARWLGFGRRTPIYYDMEAFSRRQKVVALRFLSAWTAELHRLGYLSGVYSSSASGIVYLARQYSRHLYAMPDVIYDALWNGSPNTADKVYQSGQWSNHQRIHQYSGNVTQTHGRATINIDQDYLNVNLPAPWRSTSQASPAVSRQGGAVDAFFRGANGRLWRVAYSAGSGWARPVDMGGAVRSAPSAVSVGPHIVDVFYRGADSELWEVSFRSGGGWARPRRIAMMGVLGGPPRAVAQPNGAIDVVWKGSADPHAWFGRYKPGQGWTGPKSLGGNLASSPSPVESSPGAIRVFWKGTDKSLWHVARSYSGRWSRPASLGMGPLGGPVRATAQAGGRIEVFWKGLGNNHVWAAFRGAGGWHGPAQLGGNVVSPPWPVTAAGAVHLLWRGPHGWLWHERRTARGRWRAAARLRMTGLRAAPFAAAGSQGSTLEVFWKGSGRHLCWAALTAKGTWIGPRCLGGRVA